MHPSWVYSCAQKMMLSREGLFLSQMISNSSGMLSYRSCSDKRVENSLSMAIVMSRSSLFALSSLPGSILFNFQKKEERGKKKQPPSRLSSPFDTKSSKTKKKS